MLLHSTRIYMEDGMKSGYLKVEGRFIKAFYPESEDLVPDIDYGDLRIIPGIFDTHNHGGCGYDVIYTEDMTEEDVNRLVKAQASRGVVNYLPTTSGLRNISLFAKYVDKDLDGARILGIHSEGPWGSRVGEKGINTGYPAVDLAYGEEMIRAGAGHLVLVDVAPEVEHGLEAIRFFTERGIMAGLYHTNANYREACAGIEAGATVATHLGNVMTGLHHRDVGTLGACLLSDAVDCEMICDGFHISLPMLEIYLRVKDHDHLMMISDNVVYAGLKPGLYKGSPEKASDKKTIRVTEEGFVLSETGRIDGSSQPVLYGISNLVEKMGVPMEECCKFFCYNPVRKYSDPAVKGSLKPGKHADFVVITDDYKARATWSEGRKVWDSETDTVVYRKEYIDAITLG